MNVCAAKTGNGNIQCLSINVPEKDVSAGILLIGECSRLPADSAYPDNAGAVVSGAAGKAAELINQCIRSDTPHDLKFVKKTLLDGIRDYSTEVRRIRDITGQGLYVSGVIVYAFDGRVILISLGGVWVCGSRGGGEQTNFIVEISFPNDLAIGCAEPGKAMTGKLVSGHILCSTHVAFRYPEELLQKPKMEPEDIRRLMSLVGNEDHAMLFITP